MMNIHWWLLSEYDGGLIAGKKVPKSIQQEVDIRFCENPTNRA
jgi:hypothetical protein